MKGVLNRFVLWCPGAFGLWLRQRFLPRYFLACGKGVLFGRFVNIVAPEKIILGDRVVLNNHVTIDAGSALREQPAIVLENDVFVGTDTDLCCGPAGSIVLRSGANLSSTCSVMARFPLEVGKNVLIAAYAALGNGAVKENDELTVDGKSGNKIITQVGNGCWLGVRAFIKEGVTIGEETVIGAHAEVDTDLPSFGVAVGKPAKVIRDRRAEKS